MPFINYATKTIAIKIVYYGPGLSGKTTNLRYIYFKLDSASRGELVSLETETDRTYFFDLLPIKAGIIGEFKVHFQLMTRPRPGLLRGLPQERPARRGRPRLRRRLPDPAPRRQPGELRRPAPQLPPARHRPNQIPLVFQYNKRDLNYLIPVETFNNLLNPRRVPLVEAAAINGVGVFETLREISKLTVPVVREKLFGVKTPVEPEPRSSRRLFPLRPPRKRRRRATRPPIARRPATRRRSCQVPEGDRGRARASVQGIHRQIIAPG